MHALLTTTTFKTVVEKFYVQDVVTNSNSSPSIYLQTFVESVDSTCRDGHGMPMYKYKFNTLISA